VDAARPTPAISGGPRNASEPVTGRIVPIFRSKVLVALVGVSSGDAQPERTIALAVISAMPPTTALRDREREAEAFANTLMLLLA